MCIENIAEFMFERRARELPLEELAELLDELTWALDEPTVMQVAETRRSWLEGDDPERIRVALLMKGNRSPPRLG
jgi:hypothetical protein